MPILCGVCGYFGIHFMLMVDWVCIKPDWLPFVVVTSEQLGIIVDNTSSPVVKLTTICTILSLALTTNWPVYHLDVKNAFLNGDLQRLCICINLLVLGVLGILIMYVVFTSLYMV